MKTIKLYGEEFKKRAVEMLRTSGKHAVQIARELGCTADSLRTWKRKYDNPLEGCPNPDELTPNELKRENVRLQKELNYVTEQRDLLKKSLPDTSRKIRRENLKTQILTTFTQYKKRYGRPRTFRQLRDQGEKISEKMVGRLMRSEARKKRCFRPQTTQNIERPKYSPHLLKDYQLQRSMNAKGNCYDNAAMESFGSPLKTEAFPASGFFESKEQARQQIFEDIEGYYHTQWIHSSLNYLTPLAAETVAKQAA